VFALLFLALGALARSAEPPEELSAIQRQELERQVAALDRQAEPLYRQGQFAAAARLLEQTLGLRRRLYPEANYPRGQEDLAWNLNNLGEVLCEQGEYRRALDYLQQALAMRQRLYPVEQYPQGHPETANTLNNLGSLLQRQGDYGRAREYKQRGLAMYLRLYPPEKFPQGHVQLALSLNNLGSLFQAMADYGRAREYKQQALAMYQRLYPPEKFPRGHPLLATSLNNLASLLQAEGELGRALEYSQQSLAMRQRLYPVEQYPDGHPDVASNLSNLGFILTERGEYDQALDCYQRALAMRRRLFPPEKYPRGHPDLAISLSTLSLVLDRRREWDQASEYCRQALEMRQRLYPAEQYPHGHPDLVVSLGSMGMLYLERGEYGRGREHFEQAVAMNRMLFPAELYPRGHPLVASNLGNLGDLFLRQGEYARAREQYQRALTVEQEWIEVFGAAASEAEALNYAARLPFTRDSFLSATAHLPGTDADSYLPIWRSKAALLRASERRHEALRVGLVPGSPEQRLWQELQEVRRQLARLLLTPAADPQAHQARLRELTTNKERLERLLARALPTFARRQEQERQTPVDLARVLPPHTAFVDLLGYYRIEYDPKVPGYKGRRVIASGVAFVLAPGRTVRRVELGPGEPIVKALFEWRRDIAEQKASDAAAVLRRLVWEPLLPHLPDGTTTVFLAPDGVLSQLPWAALPGRRSGTVLLEDYALAVVPHGPYLLEHLTAAAETSRAGGRLLAVGGVSYDRAPGVPFPADKDPVAARAAARSDRPLRWEYLGGTAREVDRVVALAGSRSVTCRRGAEASVSRLLADLPEARWAHLATHGFFADGRLRSALQLDEGLFRRERERFRFEPGARNPLVLSGLVLAGANLPTVDGVADGGLLTAETIAGLDLRRLDLAVLSACETGLGELAGGEGVFGLQRAFHLAGTRNVVASLWRVDDAATSALMALFYHKLWGEGQPSLAALRAAQLTLYRHPERIGDLAKERGPDFDKIIRLPVLPNPGASEAPGGTAPVKLWAGFVLSGVGR
jgi:CHAT domain-containing protein/tetratricopeptide (TPR) repeat protein